jgi:hypothetical protein
MGSLVPPINLNGSCSAVFNNTLYAYSPDGFVTLPMQPGAQWTKLAPGVSVQDAQCLSVDDSTTPAFYVVGGRPNGTEASYPGFQRFAYDTQTWETITLPAPVAQNRIYHGIAYLADSAQILMYAGSQDPNNNNPSSQTFLLSTTPPFTVLSFVSVAPPLSGPIIMPWNTSHAIMAGGSTTSKELYLFGPGGWSDLGTSLPEPVTNPAAQYCSMLTGDDSSKVLQLYNLGVVPNTVERYMLWTDGQVQPPGVVPGAPTRRRRDLTISSWPAYNSTDAPMTTRSGYSVAQAPNGYAVIVGGSANQPVAIFDQKQNGWVNPTAVFGQAALKPTASPTAHNATATMAAKPANSGNVEPQNKALTVLGGTLGGVLGLAAVLVIILVLVRWSSDRAERRAARRRELTEKDDRLSFADQGAAFMREAGGRVDMNGSMTSLQIISNKPVGGPRVAHRRGQLSDDSTLELVRNSHPIGEADMAEMGCMAGGDAAARGGVAAAAAVGVPPDTPLRAEQSRSAGWSQYFADNNLTNLAAAPSTAPSQRSSDASDSEYDESRRPSGMRPLDVGHGAIARVGQAAGPGRAISTSTYDRSTHHWSVLSEEDPLPGQQGGQGNRRSSVMTQFPTVGGGPVFGNAFANKNAAVSSSTSSSDPAAAAGAANLLGSSPPNFSSRDFPMPRAYQTTTNTTQGVGMPVFPTPTAAPGRSSPAGGGLGPLPMPVGQRGPVLRKMTGDEDMSWLNINAGRAM